MGEFTVSVRHGVLSHLEKLEASAHTAALEQGERRQHAEKVARMEARIQELKRQRDQLRAKLNACRSRFNRHKDSAESNSQAAAPTELSQQALLEWKMGNVKGLLQLFRLTGFSGRLTQHRACLCITTAFQGTYLDSYHLDLLMQEPVQIQHHSVPAFIPLEQIAAKYLQTDLKRFLSELSDHLNAYAGRKFQAEQLKEHFAAFLKGPLRGNSLHNLLEFSYGVSEAAPFPFTVKLIYGDPVSTLPTEATVTCEGERAAARGLVESGVTTPQPRHTEHRHFNCPSAWLGGNNRSEVTCSGREKRADLAERGPLPSDSLALVVPLLQQKTRLALPQRWQPFIRPGCSRNLSTRP
ncbi:centromere protein O isoform X1 [Varanus komodoensis]|uniref:centromere protein O isoform X1 n=1 Tax=Varanus komodoensis TaxID=61221 RepID=UPI001CF7C66D|nr:centromere protein O isoform X1 [Varanus komodoensis]XP_044306218.1 centromere protein O isoform X1 [Varanus komodoensis]XP_044306219.1 centromere protein O isoform X1 [Varanus komodoensis]